MEIPTFSSNFLDCGCHAHTTPPPSTFFNIHLHKLLSQASANQIQELYHSFENDIRRILLSKFIDRVSLHKDMTYDQQSHYYNTFNHIINKPSDSNSDIKTIEIIETDEKHYQEETQTDELDDQDIVNFISDITEEHAPSKVYLPDACWSRIFQFVDQKTRLLSLTICDRDFHSIALSPSTWPTLQISCSSIYFHFERSFLFSHFVIKSGRCISSLILRDIASMNESHWNHFIDFLTYFCPKIMNVRIRSSITNNGERRPSNNRSSNQQLNFLNNKDRSDGLFQQLIGSNIHMHQYHHYFHNRQTTQFITYSNIVKSHIFNTLNVFVRHYKKYGGLLIPQNCNINDVNLSNKKRINTGNNQTYVNDDHSQTAHHNHIHQIINGLGGTTTHVHGTNDNNNNAHNDHYNDSNDDYYGNDGYSAFLQGVFDEIEHKDSNMNKKGDELNPHFYVKGRKHDLTSYYSFNDAILKYQRNEYQFDDSNSHLLGPTTLHHSSSHPNNNNANTNILESFCKLSLNQLKTNCVIRPKNLCSFLQKQPSLTVLKASVRYRRDWSESENAWFWKIPSCLPSKLEIFFLPGHHALPEMWVENCLANLNNLKYFDFFIVNNKYIPSVSINTIYVLSKHCHEIQFVHLHINLESYIQRMRSDNIKVKDPYVVFTKDLGEALQLLFANCLKLQRVYCYLPIKFEPSLLLQQIICVQLPSKRRCKLRIDEYKIGGVKCRRFVFKLMDDVNRKVSSMIV